MNSLEKMSYEELKEDHVDLRPSQDSKMKFQSNSRELCWCSVIDGFQSVVKTHVVPLSHFRRRIDV